MKQRTSFIIAVFLFLIKDDKVLLTRRYQTGYEDGNYSTISGHLERSEAVDEAIIREAKEEAGIGIKLQNLHLFHILTRMSEHERLDIFYYATKWKGIPRNMEPNLCDDFQWFRFDDLPSNIIPFIKDVLYFYKKKEMYSKRDW